MFCVLLCWNFAFTKRKAFNSPNDEYKIFVVKNYNRKCFAFFTVAVLPKYDMHTFATENVYVTVILETIVLFAACAIRLCFFFFFCSFSSFRAVGREKYFALKYTGYCFKYISIRIRNRFICKRIRISQGSTQK